MSEDVPVFRSDAPHQVAVQKVGGDAVGPHASHDEPGESRRIVDNVVFAPLDEPKSLSDLDMAPEFSVAQTTGSDASPDANPAERAAVSPEPETPADRARRIRRLSPDLMDRVAMVRAELEATAVIVEGVIASFVDFNPDTLGLSDPSVAQGVLPDATVTAKEPA